MLSNQWLQNKSFIQWRLFPTQEDNLYWEMFMKDNPHLIDEIEEAISILKSIKLNAQKLSQEEKQNLFELIQKDIERRNKQRRFRIYLTASAVACVALLLILLQPLFSSKNEITQENLLVTVDSSSVNHKDIQLVLANNKTITFEKDADIKYDKKGEITANAGAEQIKVSKTVVEETTLNTLIVPKGKRSSLTLADGSKVWINSGSTLKFPTTFDANKREIWVNGEIYIEVEKNKDQPFYVNTDRMEINVVGTQFNVTAYDEDTDYSVVLVEGCVDVSVDEEKARLQPSQMLSVSKDQISVKKINVNNYISWKEGYLQFTSEPLSNILKRLSRYYDTPIDYDENIAQLKCNGKLVLFDNLEDVMKTIYNTIPIEYSQKTDRIFVQKR
ncbi:DUF4974 domain-containing protein [Parabacteroides sp. AF48-14]|nr:DUF4974 domain-containing protein [Parabacteroides sp. AF48-14]